MLTQTPITSVASINSTDLLDQRYPPGSRVVLLPPASKGEQGSVRVLSKGLLSAGAPVVCPSGDCVYFAGKPAANATWQIYAVKPAGGQPKAFTSIEGGAMDPAIISTGEIVFSSPVPKAGETWVTATPAALYVQAAGGKPRRLTFGPTSAVEPTVLRDGRILFVSARALAQKEAPDLGLFTVNNDGTEVTAFGVNHDGAPFISRPRELLDGRIGFLSSTTSTANAGMSAESVRTARPFQSRQALLPVAMGDCRAIEPDHTGALLLCLQTQGLMGREMRDSYALYRVAPEEKAQGQLLLKDPSWNVVEAMRVLPQPYPIGHVTAIMPTKKFGTILCLNANFTRPDGRANRPGEPLKPAKVRIFTRNKGQTSTIGEVALQSDGSFMAQVPAEVPLGFESIDGQGNTLQRSEPFVWVRPGENRSCIGCHEPYNRTIPNIRPLAASLPPVVLQKGGS